MKLFKDYSILITGGTGSFGKAVLKRIVKNGDFKRIVIFSRDEKKQYDLRLQYNFDNIEFIIGDTRDKSSLEYAFKDIDYVFHAAALKHVPSCEYFPMEAIKTNIHGSQNVLDVSENNAVKKVVVLSTDKAVFPINAMGMTKALMEKLMFAKARRKHTNTVFCGVRYGNVLYSRGSVIPLFVKQILNKVPITLTHPEMTRFLLTLDEAIDLVFYSIENGNNGDLFIMKAPSAKMIDMAHALMNIFGIIVPIKDIGIREGEKMHETLMTAEDMFLSQDCGKFFRVRYDNSIDYEKYFTRGMVISELNDFNSNTSTNLGIPEIEKILKEIPEIKELLISRSNN